MTDQAVDTSGSATAARTGPAGTARAPAPEKPDTAVERSAAAGASPGTAPGMIRFVGRRRELAALRADIERSGLDTLAGRKAARSRVLLIAGRPGSGRTALAEELARELAADYPDGLLRARLTTPGGDAVPTEHTARELLSALGVPAPAGAGEDELTEALREALAGRRALIVLDDAAGAEQVEPLLPDAADCLVVAVAEGPLTGIANVRPCTVGVLDSAAAVELLGQFAGSTRITVDPRSAEALAEECGGQPAALVLAGGWLAARPKASVADLAQRLRDLPAGDDRPRGGRPLARAFRLVHDSLPPPAARILRLLALAPGGFTDALAASALAGCSVSAAESTLDDFARHGLLRTVPCGSAAPLYQTPGCLGPLLRALAQVQERPAELELARARMLERTVRQLQSCRAVTEPSDSPARRKLAGLPRALRFPSARVAGEWLRGRLPALLAAASTAVADGELDTLDRRLMAALVRALIAHQGADGAAPELYRLHQLVLDVAERRALPREKAAALLNLADLDARAGRTQQALGRYRGALDAAREVGDPLATGRALESLGGAYQELGDWQRSADWYGRALALRLTRGELADEARLHGRLGAVHSYAARWGEALRDWRAAAAVHRRLRDLSGHARALSEAARVQEYAGRPQESLRTCQEALAEAQQAGDGRLQAALQLRIADTFDRLGDPVAARLHRSLGDRLREENPE
ncbi:tetratricopeptide repeat protein [Streptomyces sp. H27-D2]|uniref:tetratricopeptide repeat protein n=1 Tax=Streptomyces sp. H27-D2 TaxID=3046304 RepID=UPI002DBCB6D4|nr:tetratricopeptide repeat protein [Streptomyces sp. H27-D2]MEC4020169.1 tetratricopeptide repeat protein [Streptomyces sp. H27-D2]